MIRAKYVTRWCSLVGNMTTCHPADNRQFGREQSEAQLIAGEAVSCMPLTRSKFGQSSGLWGLVAI